MSNDMPIYDQLLRDKSLSPAELKKEWQTLVKYPATENKRSFAGNKLLYHYMLDALCRVKNAKGQSIKHELTDPERLTYWTEQMEKVNRTGTLAVRYFEVVRVCRLGVNFFKPSVAKYLYKKFKATSVLDPCAGWGGRLLAALSLGIDYTGYDTNPDLRQPYTRMLAALAPEECQTTLVANDSRLSATSRKNIYQMNWESSLADADFNHLTYDFVLTSPPYENLEVYNGMDAFASQKAYYEDFLIPLLDKCRTHIQDGGLVAFNISPKMYELLTGRYKYPVCLISEEFLQQKRFNKDKGDKVYLWGKKV